MGNTPSQSGIINEISNTISSKTKNVCSTNSSNLQTISVSNLYLNNCDVKFKGFSQVTNSAVNANCFQSSNFKELMKSEFDSKLSTLSGEVGTTLRNALLNSTAVENISSCMASQVNIQGMRFNNITVNCPPDGKFTMEDISQTITSNLLTDCIQASVDEKNMQYKASTEPEQNAEPKVEQKDSQKNSQFKEIMMYGTGILFIIFIIILIIVLVKK